MAQVSVKRCVACACRISSSRFLHLCFIRGPCCSRTVTSTPPSRPHRLRPALPHTKSAGPAHIRTSAEEFGYLADPTHPARWAVHFQHFLQYIQVSFTRRLNLESATLASGICGQRWISRRRLVWRRRIWEHYLEKRITGVQHQKQNVWTNGTQWTWNRGKRTWLCVVPSRSSIQNSLRVFKTSKTRRQSRLTENLQTNFEAIMMQELHSIQSRNQGRMEVNERTVAKMIGSEARGVSRGQRNQMLHEQHVFLQAGEEEK